MKTGFLFLKRKDDVDTVFEKLYSEHYRAVERYVRFKVSDKFESDDILQEIHIAVYRSFGGLKSNDAFNRYQKLWTEILPESEKIVVNGEIYVNWYDCITDYII